MIIENTLPKELASILSSPAFEEDEVYITIDSVTLKGRNLRLTYTFHYNNSSPSQHWQLDVSGVQQERIDSGMDNGSSNYISSIRYYYLIQIAM